MKYPNKLRFVVLLVSTFIIMLSYQNCGTNDVEFSELGAVVSSSNKPDFSVTFTQQVDVGNLGHFLAKSGSRDFQIEEVIWTFDDGEHINSAEGIRLFNSVGLIPFEVRARFTGSDDWVIKKNLAVNVIDPSNNSCLDLNNLRLVSEQVDFSAANPQWTQAEDPLHVKLNFSICRAVHLYDVNWYVHSVSDGSQVLISNSHEANVVFPHAGLFRIRATVKYGTDPQLYEVEKVLDVRMRDVNCKPKEGIGADTDIKRLYVGDSAKFSSFFPACLGFTDEIAWYVNNQAISTMASFTHTFESVGPFTVRADVVRQIDGVRENLQYYLEGEVLSATASESCTEITNSLQAGIVFQSGEFELAVALPYPQMNTELILPAKTDLSTAHLSYRVYTKGLENGIIDSNEYYFIQEDKQETIQTPHLYSYKPGKLATGVKGYKIEAVFTYDTKACDRPITVVKSLEYSVKGSSGYSWTCGNCGMICIDNSTGEKVSSLSCGPQPTNFACPDVCNPELEAQ